MIIFSKKTQTRIFRYGLGECMYQISSLYRFSFGQGSGRDSQQQICEWIKEYPLPAARLTRIWKTNFRYALEDCVNQINLARVW